MSKNFRLAGEQLRGKYGNRRTELDGHTFDSQAEAQRYGELCLWVKSGEISNLRVHPVFPLHVNGMLIARYEADFEYTNQAGQRVVEDVKATPTKTGAYRLKKKLMKAIYSIDIVEVES